MPKKNPDRDIDLVKIQLLSVFYESRINLIASLFVGIFIGLAVTGLTITKEGFIPYVSWIMLIFVSIIGIYLAFMYLDRASRRINYWSKKVEIGEKLPSLDEMKKTEIPKNEDEKTK